MKYLYSAFISKNDDRCGTDNSKELVCLLYEIRRVFLELYKLGRIQSTFDEDLKLFCRADYDIFITGRY